MSALPKKNLDVRMTRMHNHIQFVQETRWIDDAEERAALIGKIDAAAGHDVDVNELTEKEERGFIDGWENEGGFMDDCVSDHPCPWCSPWYSGEGVLKLRGDTPQSGVRPTSVGSRQH